MVFLEVHVVLYFRGGASSGYPQRIFLWRNKEKNIQGLLPISMAQLDARPTGDQEVTGLIHARSGNISLWRLIMKYFLWSFSPFCCFKKGSCQFLAKECAQILVNCLEN